MHKILVCDSIADEGLEILRSVGQVEVRTGLSETELTSAVKHAAAIVVRSSTQITAPVLEAAGECQVVARAGVGVDNIDVPAATRRGILVVNSPAGNILAAAEHTVALLLAAARHVPQADRSMKAGEWDRKNFAGRQIEGKTLGLIGFGNVGRAVARRAQALGMRVVAYDPYVTEERAAADGVELVSLDQVLSQGHFISLHAVATAASEGLIGERELALVRPGAILVNTARGALVDEMALVSALREGRLAAAALDVFAEEPTPNLELVGLPNVIATPHVGALTEEAQVNVAVDAARQVADVLAGRPPRWPVNAPVLPSEALETLAPMVPLVRALGRLSRSLLQGPLRSLEMLCSETLTSDHLRYLTGVALATLLEGTTEEPVNVVNARVLAEERHVEVGEDRSSEDRGYTNLVELRVGADEAVTVWGALLDRDRPRIVNVDGYEMDLPPVGLTLLVWREGHGRPGFVGRVGSLLGDAGISITAIQVSQRADAGVGLMALSVRSEIPAEVLRQIAAEHGVVRTCTVDFGS
ncbi:MAG: phosphoglycerate dehydrogenase [Armatimonadetes bacterium]|nr:phosphoglycerate dehydrogenase [Armatimonadota bacterium]